MEENIRKDGKPPVDADPNPSDTSVDILMEKKKRMSLSFFSHKIGIGKALGLQEYMVVVDYGKEDELEVWGYKSNFVQYLLTMMMILMSAGLLGLLLFNLKHWWLYFTQEACLLEEATTVLVVDHYRGQHTTYYVEKVHRTDHPEEDLIIPDNDYGGFKETLSFRYFICKKNRYYWDSAWGTFFKLEGLDKKMSIGELHASNKGLKKDEAKLRADLFGSNEIIVPLESIFVLLVNQILSPFYIFQVFSVILWFFYDYYSYACAIIVLSSFSICYALYQTRKNQRNLRDTIVSSGHVTRLAPDGSTENINSPLLVPGDVILIPDHGCQLLYDAVLLEGQAIVDESMLTGESVPVTKTSLPKQPPKTLYNPKDHEQHTLKCGTEVIQTRKKPDQKVKAIVIRTGYNTTKGDLVRSILYPPPVDFKFEKDSYKFIGLLTGIAIIGMIYTLVKMVLAEEEAKYIVLKTLDLITVVVPPALPVAMTIGIALASRRLIPKNIFCISPRTINVAGAVDCACLDKTGTITEDGMDMWGVVPTIKGISKMLVNGDKTVGWHHPEHDVRNLPHDCLLILGIATCHELNIIDGVMRGDPLDEKMFSSTGWNLEFQGEEHSQVDKLSMPYIKSPSNSKDSNIQAVPLKIFQFSSEVQRMSVIIRVVEETAKGFSDPVTIMFCKGSPEKIQELCVPETIPEDFDSLLERYASCGFRVIALASKAIEPKIAKVSKQNKLSREEIECNLEFLGLIILENKLKKASVGVIKELTNAQIRTVMITGDNILTAVSVARESGMVPHGEEIIQCKAEIVDGDPIVTWVKLENERKMSGMIMETNDFKINVESRSYHLAIDGPSFDVLCDSFRASVLPYLATRGTVFARMRPEMKQRLVEILQDLDYIIIMCGDGANDVGALKAANAGISLSDTEASVAAPFTSKTQDISCIPILIRESRCALVTSFGIFKYMAAYSLTQFVSVIILYEKFGNLSDLQYLWIDMFMITPMIAVFGFTKAFDGPLAPEPPMSSLISTVPLFSLISQTIIVTIVQVVGLLVVQAQSWFVGFDSKNHCYLNTTAEANFNRQQLNSTGCDPEVHPPPVASYENFTIFSISQFQYIILIIAFAKGAPYRQIVFKNVLLILLIVLLTGIGVFLTIWPDSWSFIAIYIRQFAFPPDNMGFRWILLAFAVGNLVCSILSESLLADKLVKKLAVRKRKKHELIDTELDNRSDWPPVSAENPILETSSGHIDGQSSNEGSMKVVITKKDETKSKENAFESLLDTFKLPSYKKQSSQQSNSAASKEPPWRTHPLDDGEDLDPASRR